ncbi:transposase [Ureibacillus thermosphaericus]|uniref:transposase n=1 Tax=Ureibacillus thermosphaericus TaxID=51173 RepID=UPI003908A8E4
MLVDTTGIIFYTKNETCDKTLTKCNRQNVGVILRLLNYVENTLKYDYNNDILEGIHNKIKVMKRISFGYRSFYHFRNRIFITQNLAKIKTA